MTSAKINSLIKLDSMEQWTKCNWVKVIPRIIFRDPVRHSYNNKKKTVKEIETLDLFWNILDILLLSNEAGYVLIGKV